MLIRKERHSYTLTEMTQRQNTVIPKDNCYIFQVMTGMKINRATGESEF